MGPTATVKATLTLLRHSRPDLALVDVNLSDGAMFPVADALAAAGIPFVMLTGHGREVLPSAHRHRPYMTKPFVPNKLLAAISNAMLTRDLPRTSPPA
jgi:DNA-binding response OmpR family regulator